MRTFGRLSLAALMIASTCGVALSQDIGTIQATGPAAWVNKMPPGPFSIHARGMITAPTPCHRTSTSYEGDSKSAPPVYRVKVTIAEQPGVICIQVISSIPFEFDQADYAGEHAEMEIFSDTDSKTVKIDVVQ